MKNILITSAGKRVELVKEFKETVRSIDETIKVLTTELNPEMAPAGYVADGCIKVPRVTADGYIDELLQICVANNVGLIVPTIDTELMVLAKNVNAFKKIGCQLLVSSQDFVEKCRDKRLISDFFVEHGVRIAKPYDKHNPQFPMFAKPYDGSLSTNIHVIRSQEDLTTEIMSDPKLMFMEYIDKSEYKEFTVDMYYGKDNKLKCVVPRERIEIRAGEINKGRTHKNYLVEYLNERLGYIPGVIGCVCMQVFYREQDNDVVGIEINPRFGGGYPLSYAAGANYPAMAIKEYLLGEDIEEFADWNDNVLMLRYDAAVIVNN